MSGLARYALKGTLQAGALIAGFLVLGVVFPPLLWLSCALLAVVSLRHGSRQGLVTMMLAITVATVMFYVTLGSPRSLLMLTLIFWLPAFVLACVLRAYVKLDYSLLLAGIFGVAGLASMYLLYDDPAVVWLELLQVVMPADVWAQQLKLSTADYAVLIENMAKFMPASIAACLVFSAIISLLLARGWQAKLFNPGGFQSEFHQLRFGRYPALATLAVALVGVLSQSVFWLGVLTLLMLVFLFQGIAVVHAVVKLRSLGSGWLVGMYVLCLLVPQTTLLLGGVGLADAWIDSRKRLSAGKLSD